jgi:hypothetical protein
MTQNERTLERVFHLTQEEVRVASNVVASTLLMNNFNVHVLFDLSVTHSFIARRIVTKIERGESNRKRVHNWNSDGK